jgi:hypothetical protein
MRVRRFALDQSQDAASRQPPAAAGPEHVRLIWDKNLSRAVCGTESWLGTRGIAVRGASCPVAPGVNEFVLGRPNNTEWMPNNVGAQRKSEGLRRLAAILAADNTTLMGYEKLGYRSNRTPFLKSTNRRRRARTRRGRFGSRTGTEGQRLFVPKGRLGYPERSAVECFAESASELFPRVGLPKHFDLSQGLGHGERHIAVSGRQQHLEVGFH